MDFIDVYLIRRRRGDQGTEGFLSVPDFGFCCFSLELPWRDNKPNISCIPPGIYPLAWRISKRFKAFHIQNVPGRSYILIHSANFAGDTAMAFRTDVEGCVALGKRIGTLYGQRAVLSSRAAVKQFNKLLTGKKARIIILEQWENTHMDDCDLANRNDEFFRKQAINRQLNKGVALGKISRKTCIDCEEDIPKVRRKAVPGCLRCVKCESEFERNQK